MMNLIRRLLKDESAISATEYGIIAAVFAVALIGIILKFRGQVASLFDDVGNQVAGASSAGGAPPTP